MEDWGGGRGLHSRKCSASVESGACQSTRIACRSCDTAGAGHDFSPLDFCGEKPQDLFGFRERLTPRFGLAPVSCVQQKAGALVCYSVHGGRYISHRLLSCRLASDHAGRFAFVAKSFFPLGQIVHGFGVFLKRLISFCDALGVIPVAPGPQGRSNSRNRLNVRNVARECGKRWAAGVGKGDCAKSANHPQLGVGSVMGMPESRWKS